MTLPKEVEDARYLYATACEDMGMAHASGDRAAWSGAAHREAVARLALNEAILAWGEGVRLAALREVRDLLAAWKRNRASPRYGTGTPGPLFAAGMAQEADAMIAGLEIALASRPEPVPFTNKPCRNQANMHYCSLCGLAIPGAPEPAPESEGYCVCGHASMAHCAGGCLIVGGRHGGCGCREFRPSPCSETTEDL